MSKSGPKLAERRPLSTIMTRRGCYAPLIEHSATAFLAVKPVFLPTKIEAEKNEKLSGRLFFDFRDSDRNDVRIHHFRLVSCESDREGQLATAQYLPVLIGDSQKGGQGLHIIVLCRPSLSTYGHREDHLDLFVVDDAFAGQEADLRAQGDIGNVATVAGRKPGYPVRINRDAYFGAINMNHIPIGTGSQNPGRQYAADN